MTWRKATQAAMADLLAETSGKSGDEDAETVIAWAKSDPDIIEITTTKGADAARMIRRFGSEITHYFSNGHSVSFKVPVRSSDGRKVFRGFEYAFAPVDVESKPWGER